MLFVLEYPKTPEGFSDQPVTTLIFNLGSVLGTLDDVVRFLSHIPDQGPGSGRRAKAKLYTYLPSRRADLVVFRDGEEDPRMALVRDDEMVGEPDDAALAELWVIQHLRAIFLALNSQGDDVPLDTLKTLLDDVLARAPGYDLAAEMTALLYRQAGDLPGAEEKLRGLLDEQPVNARRVLADVLAAQGKTEEALAMVAEALGQNPEDHQRPQLLHLQAYLQHQSGKPEVARATITALLAGDPDFDPALGALCACEMDLGDYDAALAHVATAAGRFGQSPAMEQLQVGAAQQLLEHLPPHEAEPIIRKHLPKLPGVLHALCAAYVDLEATAAAEERLRELLEDFPGDARAHYNLGVLSEDPEELVRRCREALKADPSYHPPRMALPQALTLAQRRNQDLVAQNVTADLMHDTTHGETATLTGVPVTAELVYSLVFHPQGVLGVDGDEHLHLLLAAKGHNRRFETGEADKYAEIWVDEPPTDAFLNLAGAVFWVTPQGKVVVSAPVAVVQAGQTNEDRKPLVHPHERPVPVPRHLAAEVPGEATLPWLYGEPEPPAEDISGGGKRPWFKRP